MYKRQIYGLGNIIENAVDFASETVEIAARWDEKEVSITAVSYTHLTLPTSDLV